MGFQEINNDEGGLSVRNKLNSMFTELYGWFANIVVTLAGNQTILGKKTFDTLPESSVVATGDDQFVNKKYVDDNVAGGSDWTTVGTGGDYETYSAAFGSGDTLKRIRQVSDVEFDLNIANHTDDVIIDLDGWTFTINKYITFTAGSLTIENGTIRYGTGLAGANVVFVNTTKYNFVLRNIKAFKNNAGDHCLTNNGYLETVEITSGTGQHSGLRNFGGVAVNLKFTGMGGAYPINTLSQCSITGLELYGAILAGTISNAVNVKVDTAATGRCRFVRCSNVTFLQTVRCSVDGCTFDNCRVSTGTIIVNATADKTILTSNRTSTVIVNNGTNTLGLGPESTNTTL